MDERLATADTPMVENMASAKSYKPVAYTRLFAKESSGEVDAVVATAIMDERSMYSSAWNLARTVGSIRDTV